MSFIIQIIANVFLLSGLIFLLFKLFKNDFPIKIIALAVVLKVLASLIINSIYIYHYKEGDLVMMLEEVKTLNLLYKNNPIEYFNVITSGLYYVPNYFYYVADNKAFMICKLVSLMSFITTTNLYSIGLYFAIGSLFAAFYITKKINLIFPNSKFPALVSFVFFPSILLWTSSIFKETIALSALYLCIGLMIDFLKPNNKFWYGKLLVIVFLLMIIAFLKYYIIGIFLPFLVAFYLIFKFDELIKPLSIFLKIFMLLLTVSFLFLLANELGFRYIDPNMKLDLIPKVIYTSYTTLTEITINISKKTGGLTNFQDLEPTWNSILSNSPQAFFNGFFMPTIVNNLTVLQLIFAIENTFLLFLFIVLIYVIIFEKHKKQTPYIFFEITLFFIIVILSVIIGMSTPNWGTLARIKVNYLPFFVFIISLNCYSFLLRKKTFKTYFKNLKEKFI